ncbi:MAG: HaeIII family restriction endonuclease, partial [Ruminiclostridium sp.]|nr:HaeIII family restriction endonuclease [Ruminiclostridium sp.]
MATRTAMGKAFEYACLNSIKTHLGCQEIVTIQTNSVNVAECFYNEISKEVKKRMDLAANAAVRVILRLEPQLQNPLKNIPILLSLQGDETGIAGDVRDVLCIRQQNQWEIGLSCKHNHFAVKHS